MNTNFFKIIYEGTELDLEIESSELQLWKADEFNEAIGLYINVQAKGKETSYFDEVEQEACDHYVVPRIYTEWLEIPIEYIKNRDFRTLEAVRIDFKDSGEMDEIEKMVWTEAPGALYVDNHGVFEKIIIEFKYLGKGIFNVKLTGSAEIETPFEVSVDIPLEIELKAYEKRATEEELLNFFNKILNPDDFNQNWRYKDDDIFFKATPKELSED